jgi:hypothetical protein
MHIPLPNGDVLIPDAEFLKKAGDVEARTGRDWDKQGCPYAMIGGRKYRPLNEALTWLAGRIQRRNPRRTSFPKSLRQSTAPVTLPRIDLPDTS